MTAALMLWVLYLTILPIYLFDSGSVQPSNMVFMAALSALLIRDAQGAAPRRSAAGGPPVEDYLAEHGRLVCIVFLLFTLWVTLVNSIWSAALSSFKPLVFSLFQLYNLLLSYFIYRMATYDFRTFVKYTLTGFGFALTLVVVAVLAKGLNTAVRETGLFNNPNQLAFFCLSSCLVMFMGTKLGIGNSLVNQTFIGVACMLCTLTVSRAGLICCAVVFMAALVDSSRNVSRGLLTIIIAFILAVIIGAVGLVSAMETRTTKEKVVFSNRIEGRGYDRIIYHPEHLLFGAGEGEVRRHGGELASKGGELHSSVGTLVFCYGIFGLLLYSTFWYQMFMAGTGFAYRLCALAPIAYSITHNGLRFSAGVVAIMFMIYGGHALRRLSQTQTIK